MTRPAPFTQASAERAIKAARKMGLLVTGVQIMPDGGIHIAVSEPGSTPAPGLTTERRPRDAREKFGGR
jgi:hypothetical protein